MPPRRANISRRLMALALPALLGGAAMAAPEQGPLQRRAAPALGSEDPSAARVIVKYRADSTLMRALSASGAPSGAPAVRPQHAAALSQRLSLPLSDGRVLGSRTQALRGAGLSSSQLAARLAAQPDVEWAVPDQRRRIAALPNDPYLGDNLVGMTPVVGQWYLRAPSATFVSAINATGAWALTTGSATVTVAVLDTGVRPDHPDLARKLYAGYDFIEDRDTANDGGGRDGDASDPGDWTNAGECSAGEPAYPSSWHGTQVAGLIGAATDNGLGIAGVGGNVMVLPVRVLGRCGGWDSDIIAAMRWAAGVSSEPVANTHPAKVLNMSLGSAGTCPSSYREAVAELVAAGVSVVVAGGNDTGLAVATPANCPGAIAVAGVRHAGTKVGYSNVGPEIAIAAPAGNCVNLSGACLYPLMTTTNSGSTSLGANTYSDGTDFSVGTSFAAPLVAGTVGLMRSLDPTLSPQQVRAVLQASARAFPSTGADSDVVACHAPTEAEQLECYCTTGTCGAGLLDASAALARVKASAVPAPQVSIAVSDGSPAAGASVTLDGSGSTAQGGRTVAAYQWTISSGSALASFAGATDGPTATLTASAAGSVTVSLTVTDSAGLSSSANRTITVAAAPVTVQGSGGTGGGAWSPVWALGLAAAAWGLRRTRRR